MRKKFRKGLSGLIIAGIALFAIHVSFNLLKKSTKEVSADSVDTSVTVDNTGPDYASGTDVYESPASTSTTPTDENGSLTIKGTADDPNDDAYFLVVCSTNSVSAEGGTGYAPSCDATQYCISSSTTDETEATCTSTMDLGTLSESNDWYAFVCDDVTGSICSTASQGTLADGSESPFKVNHRPSFSSFSHNGPVAPGANLTFSTTSSDSDTDGSADTISLYVCDTNSFNGSACGGSEYCSVTGGTSNLTCDYTQPNPYRDTTKDAYAFIVDNHGLQADPQQSTTFEPTNIAPVVSAVNVNGGSNINLTVVGGVTSIDLTATVSDDNSCQDIGTVNGYLYRSAVTYTGCDSAGEADNNNCYPEVACSVDSGTCVDANDSSATYTCSVDIQYHADPTDGDGTGETDSPWYAETWLDTVKAIDSDDTSDFHSSEVGTGVEMNSFVAMSVTSSINYGNMSAGTDSGATNQTTTVEALGNVGLDEILSGSNMTKSGCAYEIPVTNQEYSLSGFTYGTGSTLQSSTQEAQLNCDKTTSTASPASALTYWGIAIPSTICSGTFTGTNTVTATTGDTGVTANW